MAARANICFGFNLGSCTDAVHSQACQRGSHVCCRPGREQPHTALSCDTVQ